MNIEYSEGGIQPIGEPAGLPKEILTNPGAYEDELPYLKRTLGFIRQVDRSRPQGREKLYDQMTQFLINDPDRLLQIFENLDTIQTIDSGTDTTRFKNELSSRIHESSEKFISHKQWDSFKLERLITLTNDYSDSDISLLLEAVQRGFFNSATSTEEAVDIHYKAAWAMIQTEEEQTRERLFSILCNETDCLEADSNAEIFFNNGQIIGSDDSIKRFHAVEFTLWKIGEFMQFADFGSRISQVRVAQRLARNMNAYNNINPNDPRILRMMKTIERETRAYSSQRLDMLAQFNDHERIQNLSKERSILPGDSLSESEFDPKAKLAQKKEDENAPWPANLHYSTKDPLKNYVLTYFIPKVARALWEFEQALINIDSVSYAPITIGPVDIAVGSIEHNLSSEQRAIIVRDVIKTIKNQSTSESEFDAIDRDYSSIISLIEQNITLQFIYDKHRTIKIALFPHSPEEDIGRLSSILAYHRPSITAEDEERISEKARNLRTFISTNFVRTPGKRGHQIVVEDVNLRRFGYDSILFRTNSSGNLCASIIIDEQEYLIDLDKENRIVMSKDIRRFLSFQDKAWLELFILTYMEKVMCLDEKKTKDELVGGDRQYESYKRKTTNRVEHLRKLPPGQMYSQEAFMRCLRSELPVRNLDRINRDRGATRETGMWTYVSSIETEDTENADPIRIAYKTGADAIREVINLGEVSDDELRRVEEMILGDLL